MIKHPQIPHDNQPYEFLNTVRAVGNENINMKQK